MLPLIAGQSLSCFRHSTHCHAGGAQPMLALREGGFSRALHFALGVYVRLHSRVGGPCAEATVDQLPRRIARMAITTRVSSNMMSRDWKRARARTSKSEDAIAICAHLCTRQQVGSGCESNRTSVGGGGGRCKSKRGWKCRLGNGKQRHCCAVFGRSASFCTAGTNMSKRGGRGDWRHLTRWL